MNLISLFFGYFKCMAAPTFNTVMTVRGPMYKRSVAAGATFTTLGNAAVVVKIDGVATTVAATTTKRVQLVPAVNGQTFYLYQIFIQASGTAAQWRLTDDSGTPVSLFGSSDSLMPAITNDRFTLPDTASHWASVTPNKGIWLEVSALVAATFNVHLTYLPVPNT